MLESFNTKSEMQYERLTEDDKKRRGILGRLVGIIADFKNSTRNGRKYTEELWDRTFNDPIVIEKVNNRCLFGELGHPVDRQEIDMEKIAICLAEMPKKGTDGKLYGVFDILDTPNGRILKTMCDYGCNIGVSSRGSGDTVESYDGEETVEPDTYELECWDAVLLPSVKSARPHYVTESFDTSKKTLKTALLEELNNSSEEEQKVMRSTLDELDIDYSADEEESSEPVDDIEAVPETVAAEDTGASVLKDLQESLIKQQELEGTIRSLQERLSVCYTKESRYADRLGKANSTISSQEAMNIKLSEELTTKNTQIHQLNESIVTKDNTIAQLQDELKSVKASYKTLQEQYKQQTAKRETISESLSTKSGEVNKLTEALNQLKKTSESKLQEAMSQNSALVEQNSKLNEALQEAQKDTQILKSQSSAKLEKSQQLVEKYKSIARTAVDKYLCSMATKLGVSVSEIKNRLTESYSFKDIDKVCEDLQQYKLNLNSLPFSTLPAKKNVKMAIRESKEPLFAQIDKSSYNVDDDIDTTLLNFTQ